MEFKENSDQKWIKLKGNSKNVDGKKRKTELERRKSSETELVVCARFSIESRHRRWKLPWSASPVELRQRQ